MNLVGYGTDNINDGGSLTLTSGVLAFLAPPQTNASLADAPSVTREEHDVKTLFEHFDQLLRRIGALLKSAVAVGDRSFAFEYQWYRAMDMAEFSGGLVG